MPLNDHLEKLHLFREVAASGSFSRAAGRLHMSQPSLSRAVKILEEELRCVLFIRGPQGIALTGEGRKLLEFADGMYVSAQSVEGSLLKKTPRLESRVCLGTHESISIYFFPAFLKHLRTLHPELQVTLKTGRSRTMIDHLRRGDIDAAITVNPPSSKSIHSVTLFPDRFNFYVSPFLQVTDETPVILMSDALEMSGTPLGPALEKKLKQRTSQLSCENHETVRALAEESLGIALLPDHVARSGLKRGLLKRFVKRGYPVDFAPHVMAVSLLRERERDHAVRQLFQESIRFTEAWII